LAMIYHFRWYYYNFIESIRDKLKT
jgi:hypothetical protein